MIARLIDGKQKGFSLIELLVVISIIAILTTVITVSTTRAQAKARDTSRKSDLREVAAALETYKAVHRTYPVITSLNGSWTQLKTFLFPEFIDHWPEDPKRQNPAFGEGYVYATNLESIASSGSYYALDAVLEIREDATTPEIAPHQVDNGNINFFLTGSYTSQGSGEKTHYRVSGR